MKEEILKIKITLPIAGSILIEKRTDYYVMEWKDGHYELDDVVTECTQIIEAIKQFKAKLPITPKGK